MSFQSNSAQEACLGHITTDQVTVTGVGARDPHLLKDFTLEFHDLGSQS